MSDIEENKVIIFGEEIIKEKYPELYAWGKRNPNTLKISIKKMMEEKDAKNLHEAMTTLEKNQNFAKILFITGYN